MLAARPTRSSKGRGRRPGGPVRPSKPKSIIAALGDPDLFGGLFGAPSWEPWKAFLAALQALPMSEEHLALYRKHTGRSEPPTRPARYAELVVGRRGGKSRILALIATYLACVIDHRRLHRPRRDAGCRRHRQGQDAGQGDPDLHRRLSALDPVVRRADRGRACRVHSAVKWRRY